MVISFVFSPSIINEFENNFLQTPFNKSLILVTWRHWEVANKTLGLKVNIMAGSASGQEESNPAP